MRKIRNPAGFGAWNSISEGLGVESKVSNPRFWGKTQRFEVKRRCRVQTQRLEPIVWGENPKIWG